jgi:DNA recombination protein Rad52
MNFTDKQIAELAKPLDPKHVKPPKKFGPKGDYIEGWHAIAEANRIFGFDGWSYTVDLIRDDVSLGKDNDGNDQWQAAYTCLCMVEAGGVKRQDVGFGSGFAKKVGDAIEGATKEATTDALKRCLRTFGHPFGLALYDKDRANVQAPPQELPAGPINDETRDWLASKIDSTGKPVGDFCKAFEVTSLKAITYEQMDAAKEWVRKNRKVA